jgi:potassium-transporting ATPase potassium-binding subunit
MEHSDWLQLIFFLVILTALAKPMGLYLFKVLDPQGKTGLEIVLKPLEKFTYRVCGIDTKVEQDWKKYTAALFIFTTFCFAFTFLILYFQGHLPLNPQKFPSLKLHGILNVTISFITNTDWENYNAEQDMSYFSNLFAFIVQNFCSAGVGICVATAFVRGIAGNSSKSLGNFWVDIVRVSYYLFLPLSLLLALLLISEGIPQNYKPYTKAHIVDGGKEQLIVQGPMASYISIKFLGSNGGCPTAADAAHPFENPTPLSNWVQILGMMLIPTGQIYYFGKMVQNQKHAWSIYIFMVFVFLCGVYFITHLESRGNLLLSPTTFDLSQGNMEGKEQRFGIFGASLFTTASTAAANGSMNSNQCCFYPWAQGVLLQNMQVGNIIFGGVGSGLYSIIHLILISTFITALIIGRAPQYLGKKIEAFEMKMSMLPVIIFIIGILGFTSLSFLTAWGKAQLFATGPRGFTSMLYAMTSTMANNGSDFGNIDQSSLYYNITTSITMLAGRYLVILPTMALAGALVIKKRSPEETGSFPITGLTFILLIIVVYLVINALGYLPAILLGPAYEHFLILERMVVK